MREKIKRGIVIVEERRFSVEVLYLEIRLRCQDFLRILYVTNEFKSLAFNFRY
jgi:hypothetical protein